MYLLKKLWRAIYESQSIDNGVRSHCVRELNDSQNPKKIYIYPQLSMGVSISTDNKISCFKITK